MKVYCNQSIHFHFYFIKIKKEKNRHHNLICQPDHNLPKILGLKKNILIKNVQMPFKYKNKIFVYASFYYQTELEQK